MSRTSPLYWTSLMVAAALFSGGAFAQPHELGQWGTSWPLKPISGYSNASKAIHSILVPAGPIGKILCVDMQAILEPSIAEVLLVDPSIADPTSNPDGIRLVLEGPVPGNDHNLFCGSHIVLDDGRVVFVGGGGSSCAGASAKLSVYTPDLVGTGVGTFQAGFGEFWEPPEPGYGPKATRRWYPTLTYLHDRRVAVVDGACEAAINSFCYGHSPALLDPTASSNPNA